MSFLLTLQTQQQLEAVESFVHKVIDDMSGRKVDFVTLYASVISQTTTNIHTLVEEMKQCVIAYRGNENILKKMQESTSLPEKLCETVTKAIQAREDEIRKSIVRQTTNMFSNAYLCDFDWSVRVALASENMSNTKENLLILTLYLEDVNGAKKEHVMEFTKDEFKIFLGEMAKIQTSAQKLLV